MRGMRKGTEMAKFMKKPIPIEASQWNKHGDHPAVVRLPLTHEAWRVVGTPADFLGWIDTLEGGHIVSPGDWIITGVRGERYPCKPDIFEQTYELVE
jgi:hypothetical protein